MPMYTVNVQHTLKGDVPILQRLQPFKKRLRRNCTVEELNNDVRQASRARLCNVRFSSEPDTKHVYENENSPDLWWKSNELKELKIEARKVVDKQIVGRYVRTTAKLHQMITKSQPLYDSDSSDSSSDADETVWKSYIMDNMLYLADGIDHGYRALEVLETKTGFQRHVDTIEKVKNIVNLYKNLQFLQLDQVDRERILQIRISELCDRDAQYAQAIANVDALASNYTMEFI